MRAELSIDRWKNVGDGGCHAMQIANFHRIENLLLDLACRTRLAGRCNELCDLQSEKKRDEDGTFDMSDFLLLFVVRLHLIDENIVVFR